MICCSVLSPLANQEIWSPSSPIDCSSLCKASLSRKQSCTAWSYIDNVRLKEKLYVVQPNMFLSTVQLIDAREGNYIYKTGKLSLTICILLRPNFLEDISSHKWAQIPFRDLSNSD